MWNRFISLGPRLSVTSPKLGLGEVAARRSADAAGGGTPNEGQDSAARAPSRISPKRLDSTSPSCAGRGDIATAASLAILVIAFVVPGCREHPQVTSRESLDFIKQVYTACNTRNSERLTACRTKLDTLTKEGQLSEAEQKSFRTIITTAESGDWESAERSSLQFARDQLR